MKKKIMLSLLSLALFSTVANARIYEGKIEFIKVESAGITIKLPGIYRKLSGTPEEIKQMYALALSAKMADLTVQLDRDYNTETWIKIILP